MKKVKEKHGHFIENENRNFHSYDDEPAIEIDSYEEEIIMGEETIIFQVEGYKAWMKDGKLHREHGPAVIRNNGEKYYYLNGEIQGELE